MLYLIYFGMLPVLFGPVVLIGIVIFIMRRYKKSHQAGSESYLEFFRSKEETLSQSFFLLSLLFLGVTLLALNNDLGNPFSWHTILFFTSALGLVGAYYLKILYVLIFSLVGLSSWWSVVASQWRLEGKNIAATVIFAGVSFMALLFYSVGRLHEREIKWKRFALVYLVLGLITVTGALFFLSTKLGLRDLEHMTRGSSFLGSWQLTLSLLIFLAALVSATFYSVVRKLMSPIEAGAVFVLACIFGIIALLPEQRLFLGNSYRFSYFNNNLLSSAGVLWALVFNVTIFLELLGIIFSGYVRRETWLINLGAGLLFLLIAVKYFDWFFTFLDKSVFFIGAGILLFVVGWFMERGRRYMISNIKAEPQQTVQ